MSIIHTQHLFRVDLDSCPLEAALPRPLSHTDALADEIVLALRRGMTPIDPAGMQVLASLTYADGRTLPLAGHIAGSAAVLPLPGEAYARPGPFTLTLQLQSGNVRHTVLRLTGQMARTSTDSLISSGELLPPLPELLRQIDGMQAATADAQEAANAANAAAGRASDAAASMADAVTRAAPAIHRETAGDMVAFTDSAALPARAAVTQLTLQQSGTGAPSADNVRPILPHATATLTCCGRNLIPFPYLDGNTKTVNGITFSVRPDGTIHATGTSTGEAVFHLARLPKFAGDSLYVNGNGTGGATCGPCRIRDCSYDAKPRNDFAAIYLWIARGYTIDRVYAPQIEIGTAATAHEPWQGETLTAALPEEIWQGEVDWISGQLTATHASLLLTGTGFSWSEEGSSFRVPVPGMASGATLYSDRYVQATAPDADLAANEMRQSGDAIFFGSPDPAMTLAQWQAQLEASPIQLIYELAEPVRLQLLPRQVMLQHGCNTLYAACGPTRVAYTADTRLYIDEAIAQLQNA